MYVYIYMIVFVFHVGCCFYGVICFYLCL